MTESLPNNDQAPFSSPLQRNKFNDPDRERYDRLQGLEDNDDLVVRLSPIYPKTDAAHDDLDKARQAFRKDIKDKNAIAAYHKELDHVYDIETTAKYREYLSVLEDKFNIKNSGYMPVVGLNPKDGKPTTFVVTNRIEGVSTEDSLNGVPENVAVATFAKIIAFYNHLKENGGMYDFDLGLDQFVYDPDKQEMILVDHEPTNIEYVRPKVMRLANGWKKVLYKDLNWLTKTYQHSYPELTDALERLTKQS